MVLSDRPNNYCDSFCMRREALLIYNTKLKDKRIGNTKRVLQFGLLVKVYCFDPLTTRHPRD